MSLVVDHLDEHFACIEAAARLLVAGWERGGLTSARQALEHERLIDQLRSALEGRASSSPSPGGAAPQR